MAGVLLNFNIRKNISYSVLAFVCNIALVFVSYRLIIIKGGLDTIGLWSTLYAWTTMIRLGDAGMANASLRFIALCDPDKERERLIAYLQTGLISNIALFALLGSGGYLIMSHYIGSILDAKFVLVGLKVLPFMMIGFVLMNISGVLLGSLQGLHLGYINSQLSIAGNVLQLVAVFVLVPRFGVVGLAWAQVIQYLVSILAAWAFIRVKVGIHAIIPTTFSTYAFREMLGFSLKAQLANIANGMLEPLSKILVGHFSSMSALGVYELAFKTTFLTRNSVVTALTATLPAMTTMISFDKSAAWALYRRSTYLSIRITSVLLFGVVIATPVISMLWIGHFEVSYTIYSCFLSAGFLLGAYGAPAYQLGAASGMMTYNIVTSILMILILVGFGCVLGMLFGGLGVVASVGLALGVCGYLIKISNERTIFAGFARGDQPA